MTDRQAEAQAALDAFPVDLRELGWKCKCFRCGYGYKGLAGCIFGRKCKPKAEAPWNRCDVCGRFIALADFDNGAVRRLLTPDSEFTREEWETLCREHKD